MINHAVAAVNEQFEVKVTETKCYHENPSRQVGTNYRTERESGIGREEKDKKITMESRSTTHTYR